MELENIRFAHATARFIASAALAFSLTAAANLALAAEEHRYTEHGAAAIHDQLKITPAQEELWAKVAQTFNDNAKVIHELSSARKDHPDDRSAVDDLKFSGEIADAHAAGIRNLTPVFTDLYAALSPVQRKEADKLFRHGEHVHHDHRHAHHHHDAQ